MISIAFAGHMPATPKSTKGGSRVTSPFMRDPHFCSMKISEDVRKYAAEQQVSEEDALKVCMDQKAREFQTAGNEVYAKP